MATAKPNKKTVVTTNLPECPVCLEVMTAPIFQCQSGHSLCHSCTRSLCPPDCPMCRQPMTLMRNFQLEQFVENAKISCPNKKAGCIYTLPQKEVDEHLKECVFRIMDCPYGTVFGLCSWKGKLGDMMKHFNDHHPASSNVSVNSDIELDDININEFNRKMFLVSQNKHVFIVTFKLDDLKKMVYWTIQHIGGGKKMAHQYLYEIHVTSRHDYRKKIIFIEHCASDTVKADEVFDQSKCAQLPLDMLKHYVKDKKLCFKFDINKIAPPANATQNRNDSNENYSNNRGPNNPRTQYKNDRGNDNNVNQSNIRRPYNPRNQNMNDNNENQSNIRRPYNPRNQNMNDNNENQSNSGGSNNPKNRRYKAPKNN